MPTPSPKKNDKDTLLLPIEINIVVTTNESYPQIKLSRRIQDAELMKRIILCAFRGIPIIVMPTFTNKMKSINSLIDKGILYKEEDNYFFN